MANPGSVGSAMPASEDSQVRRVADVERRLREIAASVARTVSPVVVQAATAQSTADTGVTNAATAQGAAVVAAAAASTADGKAVTATTNAATAQTAANNAATAAAAADGKAVTAQTTADGKNKIIFSTSAASGTAYVEGDTWFKTTAALITGQWVFTSGAWAARTIDSLLIANLDAGKITAGTITGSTLQTAASGQRVVVSGTTNTMKFFGATTTNHAAIAGFDDNSAAGTAITIQTGSETVRFGHEVLPVGGSVEMDIPSAWVHDLVVSNLRNDLGNQVGRPVAASGGGGTGATEAVVSGCSITLPAGNWDIIASGYADWSTAGGTPPVFVFRVRSGGVGGTELVQTRVNIVNHNGQVPFTLQSQLSLSATTTVVLTAVSNGPSAGTTLASSARIRATPSF